MITVIGLRYYTPGCPCKHLSGTVFKRRWWFKPAGDSLFSF